MPISATVAINDDFALVDALVISRFWWCWYRRRWWCYHLGTSFTLLPLPLKLAYTLTALPLDVFGHFHQMEYVFLRGC